VKDDLSAFSHAKTVLWSFNYTPNRFEVQEIRQLKPPHHIVIRKLPNVLRKATYNRALFQIPRIVETIRVLGLPINVAEGATTSTSANERDTKKQKITHVID